MPSSSSFLKLSFPSTTETKSILQLAIPTILSGLSVPLLGLVDTWAMGQTHDTAAIAAIGLGAVGFSLLFWSLSFLRQSTTALTARTFGQSNNTTLDPNDRTDLIPTLLRPCSIALFFGILFLIFQAPIKTLLFQFLQGSDLVLKQAQDYYDTRIWSAPATLLTFVGAAWLLGQKRALLIFLLQAGMTLINGGFTLYFVSLGWGIKGAALGTLIADYSYAFSLFIVIWYSLRNSSLRSLSFKILFNKEKLIELFKLNLNIMIRTFLLVLSISLFLSTSGTLSTQAQAINQILLQFLLFSAYFLDGFAYVSEVEAGTALGRQDPTAFFKALYTPSLLSAVSALGLALLILLFGSQFIHFMTPDPLLRKESITYLPWVVISTFISFLAFQLDGFFLGALQTKKMRNAMILCFVFFILSLFIFPRFFGNHGIWLSWLLFLSLRGFTLALKVPSVLKDIKPRTT